MLDRMEQMARNGQKDAARRMLQELQQMLENLQMARPGDQRWLLVLIMGCYPVAYVGLIVAPHALAVVWALVLGTALVTFPIVLTLVGLRTRTAGATAALSGWTQSTGYLMAALGPFGVGVLHDATGDWTVPLLVLTGLSVPLFVVGLYVGKPAHIEDQLISS